MFNLPNKLEKVNAREAKVIVIIFILFSSYIKLMKKSFLNV